MTTPAVEILVTAGIVLFFFLGIYAMYRLPLGITLSLTRNTSQLNGDVGVRYGILSFLVCLDTEIYGRIEIFSKPVFRFSLPATLSSGKKDASDEQEEKGDGSFTLKDMIHWFGLSMRYLRYVIRHFSIDHLTLHLRMGLSDPCTTGMVFGWAWALIPQLPNHADVQVTPCFDRVVLEGYGNLTCLIHTPADLVVIASRLIIPELLRGGFR